MFLVLEFILVMDKSIFKFIFRHTKPQQIFILFITALSLPFYYISLDIPKLIVNTALESDDPAKIGDEFPRSLSVIGIEFGDLDQITLLFSLCILFLVLVCINGSFRIYINFYTGRLGERMLRRLRFILYSRVLRFPLPHFRKVSSGELIPMITSEVEPFGGFIGNAFALPALQGGLLLTAIFYIFSQDPLMGAAAIALYPIQAYIIPKLQQRVNLLAKERVHEIRRLSEQIGESVAGAQEIHSHGTAQFELADFSRRLGIIYEICYKIYNKKFFIKFLNTFLAQLTPFFFFTIGGYLVIIGDLTLGALVAVLAAYKDLAPPWMELLNFYQTKEDVRIKYEQVVNQFDPRNLMDKEKQLSEPGVYPNIKGDISLSNLTLKDDDEVLIVSGLSVKIPLNLNVAIVGTAGSGKEELLLMLARLIRPSEGKIIAGEHDLQLMPEIVTGRRISFVGQNSYIFSSTLKDNLLYGLKHKPVKTNINSSEKLYTQKEWLVEAKRTGNSTLDVNSDWVNYEGLGISDGSEFINLLLKAIDLADMSYEVYEYGLRGIINPESDKVITLKILEAREALEKKLKDEEYQGLVENFDLRKYNSNATVIENLIFGNPYDKFFENNNYIDQEYIFEALKKADLLSDLTKCGYQLAATMLELFSDLPTDHELFQQFSFISADSLPQYQSLMNRANKAKLDTLNETDKRLLLSLPLKLITARHRLNLIDAGLEEKILNARNLLHQDMPADLERRIDIFDKTKYNPSASVEDNILFGKVVYGRAQAKEKIGKLIREVVNDCGLWSTILEVGLQHHTGIGGARLSGSQRQKLAIARAAIKQPDVFIISEATAALDGMSQKRIMKNVLNNSSKPGVIWSLHRADLAKYFDVVIVMKNGAIVEQGTYEELKRNGSIFNELIEQD